MEEKTAAEKSRLYIHVCRGIAIFLMLWGHCIQYLSEDYQSNLVFRLIYSFHMPLFMLISGYLFWFSFKKRDAKTLLIHKTQGLLQPIVMGGILCFLFTFCLYEMLFAKNYLSPFGGYWIDYLNSFWFLWSVLAANIWVTVSCKYCRNTLASAFLLILGIVFVALFPNWEQNVNMYPYFLAGFLFAKYKEKIPKPILFFKYLSIPLFPILLLFFDERHYIFTTGIFGGETLAETLAVDGFRWLIGFVGSIFVLTIVDLVFLIRFSSIKKNLLLRGVGYLGEKSLQYYILSVVFLSGWLADIWEFLSGKLPFLLSQKDSPIFGGALTALISILYCFGIFVVIKLLEKTKISGLLFGRA